MDAGHWLKVAGTLRRDGALPWIEATSIAEATAPTEAVVEVAVPPPPQPVPQVVFSTPTADETDADRVAPIRIQFSRDMDGQDVHAAGCRVSYAGPAAPGRAARLPNFTVRYNEGTRAPRDQAGRAAGSLPHRQGRSAGRHPQQRRQPAARALHAHVHDGG